jgi:excinuclease ABC subunit A
LLAICDRLVELGPGGGEAGGRVIAVGTPRELARDPASVTGPWLFADPLGTPASAATRSRAASKRRRVGARAGEVGEGDR